MSVSLAKRVTTVRAARVFSSNPGIKFIRVTELSNSGVLLSYHRPDGTCVTGQAIVNNWFAVLDREIRAERAAGTFLLSEILFDVRL